MGRLAVVADKSVELDAHGRKAELFARPTIGTDAVAGEAGQFFHFLLSDARHETDKLRITPKRD